MINSKPCPTPLTGEPLTSQSTIANSTMTQDDKLFMSTKPYREAVGCLNYLVQCGRADIAVAVSSVAAFCENPYPIHWQHVKRIFRYLSGTINYGIVLGEVTISNGDKNKDSNKNKKNKSLLSITAFSDSSYAEQDGAKSRLGMILFLNGGLLKSRTKKSNHVALSTMQAEYFALAECAKDIAYVRRLLDSIGFTQTDPTILHGDNESALKLAVKEGISELSRHIQTRYHYIRECIQLGSISLKYVNTNFNVADLLTKGITEPNKFARLRMLLGITTSERLLNFHEDLLNAQDDKTLNHEKKYKRKGTVTIHQNFKPILQPINDYLNSQQDALREIPHINDDDDDDSDMNSSL
jgi:hypothetical protein